MPGRTFPVIEAAVTPRFDIFYALYALGANAGSGLDAWKQTARAKLPADFERAAARVAPLPIFWPLLADALQGVSGEISFDEMVEHLKEAPTSGLQRDILGGIFHDAATVETLISSRRSLKQMLGDEDLHGAELARHFGLRPYTADSAAVKSITNLLNEPDAFRNDLILALRRFWETGFHADWNALEPQLRAEAFRIRDLSDEGSPSVLTADLNVPVSFDDDAGMAQSKNGPSIPYSRIDHCYVIPSAFNTRKWWTKYESKNGKLTLYLPVLVNDAASAVVARKSRRSATRASGSEINAESIFRALGDTTRFAIASILARTPTTSADLARSLKVSKPTVSHHVQTLRSAGLISEAASGGSTKLSLRKDTLAALSAATLEQLFDSKGDLALTTTRKRRTG